MNLVMVSPKPMACPECNAHICVADLVGSGRCRSCKTKICTPRTFRWKVKIAAFPIAILTFCLFVELINAAMRRNTVSNGLFLSLFGGLMTWVIWLIFVAVHRLALLLAPPRIERDAGDPIRLDLK